jgi:hypothetical protein
MCNLISFLQGVKQPDLVPRFMKEDIFPHNNTHPWLTHGQLFLRVYLVKTKFDGGDKTIA